MTSLFDKWNLRPGERRLVVGVGIVLFIVLNFWLVVPKFGDWGRTEQRIRDASVKLKTFQDEIRLRTEYERQIRSVEAMGGYVATEEQANRLIDEVRSQAAISQVQLGRQEPQRNLPAGRTNSFFDEYALLVTLTTGESELVDFLYQLGQRNSLIRVRSMQLNRDPSGTRLQGSITFVESFQKKAPATLTQAGLASAPKTTNPPAKSTKPPDAGKTAVAQTKPATPVPAPKPATPAPKPAEPAKSPPKLVEPAKTAPIPTPVKTAPVPSPIAAKPTNLPKRVVSPPDKAKQP